MRKFSLYLECVAYGNPRLSGDDVLAATWVAQFQPVIFGTFWGRQQHVSGPVCAHTTMPGSLSPPKRGCVPAATSRECSTGPPGWRACFPDGVSKRTVAWGWRLTEMPQPGAGPWTVLTHRAMPGVRTLVPGPWPVGPVASAIAGWLGRTAPSRPSMPVRSCRRRSGCREAAPPRCSPDPEGVEGRVPDAQPREGAACTPGDRLPPSVSRRPGNGAGTRRPRGSPSRIPG